jgi:hypothetical protein
MNSGNDRSADNGQQAVGALPSVAERTVHLRVRLRAGDGVIIAQTATGEMFGSSYEQLEFDNWPLWLQNQAHGVHRTGMESTFRTKIDRLSKQIAKTVDVDMVCRQIDAMNLPLATAFVRVEVVDRELDNIPWELLALPVEKRLPLGGHVCVYRAVSGTVPQATSPDPPHRVLLVSSAAISSPLPIYSLEMDSIRVRLNAMMINGLVRLEWSQALDYSMIGAFMERPSRAVHIAAHGGPGEIYFREGHEQLAVGSELFAQFFTQQSRAVAVMLSICDSVRGTSNVPAVARAVAKAGVASVLGMYSPIIPQAGLVFFSSLYHALGRCSDMVSAYAYAVSRLRATTYPNCGFWSVPVLYAQSNVVPFPRPLSDPGDRSPRQNRYLDRCSISDESGMSDGDRMRLDTHSRTGLIGHVFVSYVREDSGEVERLQSVLMAAGVRVWRDMADLRPGDDWRAKIRQAIGEDALVFLACFSRKSLGRKKSYQNEELTLAIEQVRLRRPGDPWLIPVRFDDCDIPDWDIGGGRSLSSIQGVDLFGDRFEDGADKLIRTVLQILER